MKVLIVQNFAVIGFDDDSLSTINTKKKNFERVNKLVNKFEGQEIDLIILPELFSTGWYPPIYPKSFETIDNSPTMEFLSDLAKRFNSNVVGGSFVLKTKDGLKNTCPIFDRRGNLIAKYEKMHLFSHYEQGEGDFSKSGERGLIVQTDVGKLGISICYDIRFPELHRTYTYSDAEILINVAAWPKSRLHHYHLLARARAIENQIFFIGVTQTGLITNEEYNSGHSLAVNPFGDIIKELSEDEDAGLFEINLEDEMNLRNKVPTLKDKRDTYKTDFIGV